MVTVTVDGAEDDVVVEVVVGGVVVVAVVVGGVVVVEIVVVEVVVVVVWVPQFTVRVPVPPTCNVVLGLFDEATKRPPVVDQEWNA